MITTANLQATLTALGFTASGVRYETRFGDTTIAVDFAAQRIEYPEAQGLKVNERQTCNFSQNENFVVLECVHRLLSKGYKPQHIELEPKWKVGRGASGGRADILICDNAGSPLLLIECKTAGAEFNRAWRETERDGGQLFSYAQQINETRFLCLYASDFVGGEVRWQTNIVAHRDNDDYLLANTKLRGFRDATDVKDRHAIWRDTYKLDFTTKGLFEDSVEPYRVGKDKYSLEDLHAISADDQQRKFHEFATILRQHNVSGRENAFDKLVNIFLCKLVDEERNANDLNFNWKGAAYDTYLDMLDRLQRLYQAGMAEFLGEDITYISRERLRTAMRFIKSKPDATERQVWDLFVQQKFFTNNDFSLIDVHNEKLFYQNADILVKIIQMWQDIRLTRDGDRNQFLGDMFEIFLDEGVKQSEGQFFTPMPVCRFIVTSLPLDSLIGSGDKPPRCIDYACGAGHFLNELALHLEPLVAACGKYNSDACHRSIWGVEKEYRLSKVAKVSAFLYGQPGIHINYADGLVQWEKGDLANGSFDVLVTNPPFSVRGFLETLPEKDRKAYTLTDTVDEYETNGHVEAFFLERAAQLLAPGGVAAIVLPRSLLSKTQRTPIRAREILLECFDLIAVVALGGGTFGQTNTNTVTLFLRRRQDAPEPAEHYRDRVDQWFQGDRNDAEKQEAYRDWHIVQDYAGAICVTEEEYVTLLRRAPSAELLGREYFSAARQQFDSGKRAKTLRRLKGFQRLSKQQQEKMLSSEFLKWLLAGERERLYYFALAHAQPYKTLIVNSPNGSQELKAFLGYEWSKTKGKQGIKIHVDADGHHVTPLYDECDRRNPEKLNHCIAEHFEGGLDSIPESLQEFATLVPLTDMLDFSATEFTKVISLVTRQMPPLVTKWEHQPLGDLVAINPPKSELSAHDPAQLVSFVPMDVVHESGFIGTTESRTLGDLLSGSYTYFRDGDVIVAKITPSMENGKCGLAMRLTGGIALGSSEFHVFRPLDPDALLPAYLLAFLNRDMVRWVAEGNMTGSSGHRRVPAEFYQRMKIPVPSPDVQDAIAGACRVIDEEAHAARTTIQEHRFAIDAMVDAVWNSPAPLKEIDTLCAPNQYGHSKPMNTTGVGYKSFRMNDIFEGRLVDKGAMKYVELTAKEFCALSLNPGDILFNRTNSYIHVGRTGMFDLEGSYCFASYLVRLVVNAGGIDPYFLTLMMNSSNFQENAKRIAVRSQGQANINPDRIRALTVPVPDPEAQIALVRDVRENEQLIRNARVVLSSIDERKSAVLSSFF